MSGSKTAVVFSIAIIILLIMCITTPVSAGTYSITQSSKYTFSTDGTVFEPAGIHHDLSPWAVQDIEGLKKHMGNAGWESKRHYNSTQSKMEVFKNEIDKSDIHFHAGHGLNVPLIAGGHMELKNHPLPNNAVTANDVKGKWNHCKWFNIHSCHVLEDTNWANVLKGSNSHGILGFGSTTYTTGYFLSDYGEKITKGWTLAKAWEKTSYDQFKNTPENVTVRTFYKNFDQYLNDKLNTPSTNTTEDIVMCDTPVKVEKEERLITKCTFINSGRKVTIKQDGTMTEEITKRAKRRPAAKNIPYNEYKRNDEL